MENQITVCENAVLRPVENGFEVTWSEYESKSEISDTYSGRVYIGEKTQVFTLKQSAEALIFLRKKYTSAKPKVVVSIGEAMNKCCEHY